MKDENRTPNKQKIENWIGVLWMCLSYISILVGIIIINSILMVGGLISLVILGAWACSDMDSNIPRRYE